MLKWLISKVRQIVGRVKIMYSAYWTAIGAMLIPSAMVWALESSSRNYHPLIIWIPTLILSYFGIAYLHRGLADMKEESEAQAKKSKTDEVARKLEFKEHILLQRAIAKAHGAKLTRVDWLMRRYMEEEGLLDEWGQLREDDDEK